MNGIVEPIAFGATLELSPLVVLTVSTGFGAVFWMIGLVHAAPRTPAAVHIGRELTAAQAAEAARTAVAAGERPPPANLFADPLGPL